MASPPGAKVIAVLLSLGLSLLVVVLTFQSRELGRGDSDFFADRGPDCAELEKVRGGGVRLLTPIEFDFARSTVDDTREAVAISFVYAIGSPRKRFTHLYLGEGESLEPLFGLWVSSSAEGATYVPTLSELDEPNSPVGSLHPYRDSARRLRLPVGFPRGSQVQAYYYFTRKLNEEEQRQRSLTVNVTHTCAVKCERVDAENAFTTDFACPTALTDRFQRRFTQATETTVTLGLSEKVTSHNATLGVSQTPRGSEVHHLTTANSTLDTSLLLESPQAERRRYLLDTFLLLVVGSVLGSVLAWKPNRHRR